MPHRHAHPAVLSTAGEDRLLCRWTIGAQSGRWYGGPRRSPRGQLLVFGKNRRQSGRLHAVPGERRGNEPWTASLHCLLHSFAWTRGRWQRDHTVARVGIATVVP